MNKDMLNFEQVIGQGGFGMVWRVNYLGTNYALKEMDKQKILLKKNGSCIKNERHLLEIIKSE